MDSQTPAPRREKGRAHDLLEIDSSYRQAARLLYTGVGFLLEK